MHYAFFNLVDVMRAIHKRICLPRSAVSWYQDGTKIWYQNLVLGRIEGRAKRGPEILVRNMGCYPSLVGILSGCLFEQPALENIFGLFFLAGLCPWLNYATAIVLKNLRCERMLFTCLKWQGAD